MGSDGKRAREDASSEPALCVNGCGFFGSAATMNLCSKCFQEEQTSAKPTADKPVNQAEIDGVSAQVGSSSKDSVQPPPLSPSCSAEKAAARVRCLTCNKKVGVLGFTCKCGSTFCGFHRYPEKHKCQFDFKGSGKDAIAKANPVVKTDKVDRF